MNCQDVRRFLYAFDDGALEVKENLEILGHLNMCPSCAGRVDADQRLKERLAGSFGIERAPDRLRESVLTQLHPTTVRRPARWIIRAAPVLAAAAVIAVVAGLWWSQAPDGSAVPASDSIVAFDPDRPVAARELAAAFRMGHLQCSAVGRAHHAKGLSRHLPTLERELSASVGLDVLAPNWRNKSLRFVSACTCGMPGGVDGAHLIYERMHVKTVSLYTLQPTDLFDAFERDVVDGAEYRVGHSEGLNLVSWQGAGADYLLCAIGEPGRVDVLIRDLVAPIRVALAETGVDPTVGLVLAQADFDARLARLVGNVSSPAILVRQNALTWIGDAPR